MAIKKESLKKIAGLIKVPEADLEAAIKNTEEVDVAVPDGLTVLTTDELAQRDTNKKNEGITAGKEIGVKEVRTAAGLEESIGKDPKKVAEAILEKAVKDAKIEPEKQVADLKEQVNLLKGQISEKDLQITESGKKLAGATMDTKILAAFPKNRIDSLNDSEFLTLIRGAVSIEEVDGKLQVSKAGQLMRKENTQDPLSLEEALTSYFQEKKWLSEAAGGPGGGRGADDRTSKGGAITSKKDLIKKYTDAGKSIQGQEFSNELTQLVKENKDFDLTD